MCDQVYFSIRPKLYVSSLIHWLGICLMYVIVEIYLRTLNIFWQIVENKGKQFYIYIYRTLISTNKSFVTNLKIVTLTWNNFFDYSLTISPIFNFCEISIQNKYFTKVSLIRNMLSPKSFVFKRYNTDALKNA